MSSEPTVVALLLGGPSHEAAVSRATGAAVGAALRRLGHQVVEIDPGDGLDLPQRLIASQARVVYNALHGTFAEDGRLQGLLDWMGLPYTGEDARCALLTFDKGLTRALAERAGLPMPAGVVWPSDSLAGRDVSALPFPLPVMVKPVAEGSSVGISLVREASAFEAALARAATGEAVTVEAYVPGSELSVGVLGGVALGTAEIVPAREFYDYEAKYGEAGTRYYVPARIDPGVRAAVEALAERATACFGCRAATRVDFLLGPDGPVLIELNTLPGMTRTSLLPKIAAAAGMDFDALVAWILARARCGREVARGR